MSYGYAYKRPNLLGESPLFSIPPHQKLLKHFEQKFCFLQK